MKIDGSRRASLGALTAAVLACAGCASPTLDAQWRDSQLPANYLRGARLLVSCEAAEVVLKRICEDQLAAGLTARGATPVLVAAGADAAAARTAGAKAVFAVTVSVAAQSVSSGVSIGFGLGGFGGNLGGGIGVSAPVGGGKLTVGYAAMAKVSDTTSDRLMWTARTTTPPSSDANAQLAELTKSLLDAAARAGVF